MQNIFFFTWSNLTAEFVFFPLSYLTDGSPETSSTADYGEVGLFEESAEGGFSAHH